MHTKPRVPAGIPQGGEWTTAARDEAPISLESANDVLDSRYDQLIESGFVPAVATAATEDPAFTAKRDQWWDNHFIASEYQAGEGGYPQMPDDFTPSGMDGLALSGKRRTHRMKYASDELTVRMPSATSVRRFAKESGNVTFDVPVSATIADEKGDRSVSGWVRVSSNGAGGWSAVGMGFGKDTEEQVAEAVSAVLESRRPSLAIRAAGDLLQRRARKAAGLGGKLEHVDSEWIDGLGYDPENQIMATRTVKGGLYGHVVARSRYEAVANSVSPGREFNRLIKGHARAEIVNCAKCGRFHAAAAAHTCPPKATPPAPPGSAINTAARDRAREALARRAGRRRKTKLAEPTGTVDVAAAFAADRAARTVNIGRTGAPGWTQEHVASAITPFVDSNHVPAAYEDGTNGSKGLYRYAGLGHAQAGGLIDSMTHRQLSERHHMGPRLGAILATARNHPDVEVSGYVVGPHRDDERMAADGVFLRDESIGSAADALTALRDRYALTDAESGPDHVELVDVPWEPGRKAWHIRWA